MYWCVENSPVSWCVGHRHLGCIVDVLLLVGWRRETKVAFHSIMLLTPRMVLFKKKKKIGLCGSPPWKCLRWTQNKIQILKLLPYGLALSSHTHSSLLPLGIVSLEFLELTKFLPVSGHLPRFPCQKFRLWEFLLWHSRLMIWLVFVEAPFLSPA